MRTRYKPWAIEFIDKHADFLLDEQAIRALQNNDKKIIVEIGSGKGDFIVDFATLEPSYQFIACEKVDSVGGVLLKKIIDAKLTNVAYFRGDAKELLNLLPIDSIDAIFLNFPDPWPKKRHAKRRLIHRDFLNEYYRVLKKDGLLRLKTDNEDLYNFAHDEMVDSLFLSVKCGYNIDDKFSIKSEYEKKYLAMGKKIFLIEVKK